MCCNIHKPTTKQIKRRTRPFSAYKVVRRENSYDFNRNYHLIPVHGEYMIWKQGTHTCHPQSFSYDTKSNTHTCHDVSETSPYDPTNPHGFHFYFKKNDAEQVAYYDRNLRVLQIQVDPKDVIAAEKQGNFAHRRQGVAFKVTVTEDAWKLINKHPTEVVPESVRATAMTLTMHEIPENSETKPKG